VRLDPPVPIVALATAHPAKFPDAVAEAAGVRPALPARLGDLFERSEHLSELANDLATVQALMRERLRLRGAA
jgi:threonine synthase